jgi:hypothetical protein
VEVFRKLLCLGNLGVLGRHLSAAISRERTARYVYLGQQDAEIVLDVDMPTQAGVHVFAPLQVLGVIGVEPSVGELSIGDFRDARPHTVVDVERHGPICHRFVPVDVNQLAERLLAECLRTSDFQVG